MANILKFEIKTEAPYSPAELEDLHSSFEAWMKDGDDDIVEDSVRISITDENDVPDDSEKIQAAAIEMLTNNLQVGLTIDFAKGAIATIDSYSFDS